MNHIASQFFGMTSSAEGLSSLFAVYYQDMPTLLFSRDAQTQLCTIDDPSSAVHAGGEKLNWNHLQLSDREFLAKIDLIVDPDLAATLEEYNAEAFFHKARSGFLLRCHRGKGTHVWLQCIRKIENDPVTQLVFVDTSLAKNAVPRALRLPETQSTDLEITEVEWKTDLKSLMTQSSGIPESSTEPPVNTTYTTFEGLSRVHPDDRDNVLQELSIVLAGKKMTFSCEARVIAENNVYIWNEIRGVVIRDEAGTPYQLVGTLRNIAKRKHLEEEAVQLAVTYQAVASMTADVVWEQVFPDLFVTYSGPPDSPFGCVGKTLTLTETLTYLHPDDRESTRELHRQIRAGEIEFFVQEVRLSNTSGEYVWVEKRGRALRDKQGVLRKIVGSFQNISERKRTLSKQHTLAHNYQLLAELAADALWEYTPATGAFRITAPIEKLLGYAPEELALFETVLALVHPEDRHKLLHMEAQPETPLKQHFRIRHRDGSWRYFENSAAVLRNEQGVVTSLFGAFRDSTEQRNRELGLQQKFERDALTGLYSRQAGRERIERELLYGTDRGGLLSIDLTAVLPFCEQFSSAWKELFLQHVAAILHSVCCERDIVMRYGDAEFILFRKELQTAQQDVKAEPATVPDFLDLTGNDVSTSDFIDELSKLGLSLYRLLSEEYHAIEHSLAVPCSIGIAVTPHDALTFEGLLDRAFNAGPAQGGVAFHDVRVGTRLQLDSERQRQQLERERTEVSEMLRSLMDNVDAYIYVIDPETYRILFSNRQTQELIPACRPGAMCYNALLHQDTPCENCLLHNKRAGYEIDRGDHTLYLQLHHRELTWVDGKTVVVVSGIDITEQRAQSQRLEHIAYHDSLLDIPNRQAAMRDLRAYENADMNCAVLLLDIVGFKLFNEGLGQAAGDLLLKAVAEKLRQTFPDKTLYRFGGDEFMLIQRDNATLKAQGNARLVHEVFSQPLSFGDLEYKCTFDIGISVGDSETVNAGMLVTHAELALAEARKINQRTVLFTEKLERSLQRKKELDTIIRDGLEYDRFEVYFQPVYDVARKIYCKAEALLRLKDGHGAFVSPEEFIPVAEENGAIVDMGYLVLDKVCHMLKGLNPEGIEAFRIAVNISVIQFLQPNFRERVVEILHAHEIDPRQLQFEITESVLIHSFELVKSVMEELRSLGIEFSLDDFGTGYSSLGYLLYLPINTLKLDRSFIEHLEDAEGTRQLCKAIINIAEQCSIKVVAEGVETEGQARIISELGTNYIQGYYYARPLPYATLLPWIEKNTRRTSLA